MGKQCPYCQVDLPVVDAAYCDMCGSQLLSSVSISEPLHTPVARWLPLTTPLMTVACSKCGQKNAGTDKFCRHCGFQLF